MMKTLIQHQVFAQRVLLLFLIGMAYSFSLAGHGQNDLPDDEEYVADMSAFTISTKFTYTPTSTPNLYLFHSTILSSTLPVSHAKFDWRVVDDYGTIYAAGSSYLVPINSLPHTETYATGPPNECGRYFVESDITVWGLNGSVIGTASHSETFCVEIIKSVGQVSFCDECAPSELRTIGNESLAPFDFDVQQTLNNKLVIKTDNPNRSSQQVDLQLMDLNGRTVHTQSLYILSGEQTHIISIPRKSGGIYILNLQQDEFRETRKISIQ